MPTGDFKTVLDQSYIAPRESARREPIRECRRRSWTGLHGFSTRCALAALHQHPLVADAGCSTRRVRRHFAAVKDLILTGRFTSSSWESLPSEVGQVQSVTNVDFAAACRLHIGCTGGEAAIGSLPVNTLRRPHAGTKRLQRRPAISCTGGGAPDLQRCAGPCQRLNSTYSPHIVKSVKQGKYVACCASCHTPAQCQKRRGQHAAMKLRRRG